MARSVALAGALLAAVMAVVLEPGRAAAQAARPTGVAEQQPFATALLASKWQRFPIAVCWEAPTRADAVFRAITRRAVEETWERHSAVRFTGWGACQPTSRGIHIRVADEGPRVLALGRYLDGRPGGMVLNFTFQSWSESCQSQREFCVYAVAAHEFGHALGFTHEQNRDDAPKECREENAQGTDGDYKITEYDPNSIMNYCSEKWNGDGKLSDLDIEAVQTFYGR